MQLLRQHHDAERIVLSLRELREYEWVLVGFGGRMSRDHCSDGLDGRCRDADGEIRRKRSDTLVGTLRREYGEDFASSFRSDTKLGRVLRETNSDSLSDYLKHKR
jgi:hypothetical protein